MYHTKGQQICLLCHLVIQNDEIITTTRFSISQTEPASGGSQQYTFRPYNDLFCQQTYCFRCLSDQDSVSSVHYDCYNDYRHFSQDLALRLPDLLGLLPRALNFLMPPRPRSIAQEIHSYKEYFNDFITELAGNAENDPTRFLKNLPGELLSYIAELSWPCALQRPVTVFGERDSLMKLLKTQRIESIDLDYAGERVVSTRLKFMGYLYLTGLSIEKNEVAGDRDNLTVLVIRDEVGVLDVDFQARTRFSRRGCWHKLIQTDKKCLKLRICIKNIFTDIEQAKADEGSWNPYWDSLLLHSPSVSNWYMGPQKIAPKYMRYARVDSETRGIIVSCGLEGIVSIKTYAHNDMLELYDQSEDDMLNDTVRICFPLARDETITASWMREVRSELAIRSPVLVISTSSQRTCTFGPYIPLERQNEYRHQPLVTHNARITGFCFHDKGVLSPEQTRIGVTQEDESLESLPIFPFQATHILPYSPIAQWYQSCGAMAGVTRIQLYTDNKKPHQPAVGMLLVYTSHEEWLGHLGYDCNIENFELTGPMYLFSGQTETGFPYTKIACNKEMEEGWSMVPRTAEIIWWFTPSCSHLEIIRQ